MNDSAITSEHVSVHPDWLTEYSVTVKTRWFDTAKEAGAGMASYSNDGARFVKVFKECNFLGKYRVVGHFYHKKQ